MEEEKQLNVRVPASLVVALKHRGVDTGRPLGELVAEALELFLAQ